MRKRILSILTVLCLLATFLPATSLAATPTELWVAGTQITASGYWVNDDSGGIKSEGANESNYNVKYDGNGTLTLKGASVNNDHSFEVNSDANSAVIYAVGDLNLVLEETSTVGGDAVNGIYTTGSLTVNGTGTANITIAATDGCGIFTEGSLTNLGGTVTVTANVGNSCGISAASVTVDGGTVSAQGSVIGLLSRSTISVSTGNLAGRGGVGLFSMTEFSVSNGTVAGTSKESVDGGYSFGVYTLESLTITGGSVTGTGVGAGIAAVEGMTISGSSTVTATGTGTTGDSYGVASQGDVAITDTPNVTATGHTAGIVLDENKLFTLNGSVFSLSGTTVKVEAGQATQGLTPAAPPADDGVNTEAELIAAIEQGGEITLTGNIDLTEALTINKTVTLDLNGHTLSCQQVSDNEAAVYIEGPAAVTINDSSGDSGSIQGNGKGYGILVKSNASLVVDNGTFSGGAFYCIAIEWRSSNVNVTLNGGTYNNGVSVSTINGGTFNNGTSEVGTITNGTFGVDTEAQAYYFFGGTFNGKAQCWSEIQGGTFNGNLTLGNNYGNSVSGCSINKALEWKADTPPSFDDSVIFADGIKIYNDGYEIVDGKLQAIPEYTVIVNSADPTKGTVEVTGFRVSKPGAALSLDSISLDGGGKKWENVYRDYTVRISKTTVNPKAGYIFMGWYDNPDGTGIPYSTAESLSYDAGEEGIQNNISFYAVFEDDETYDAKVDAAEKWLSDCESSSSYEIDSIGDMESFAVAVNYLGKNFSGKTVKLANNLTYTDADSFTPIGNSGIAFKGTFDGQSHTISGLRYSTTNQSSAYVGLFGNVNSAEIKALTLSGVNFSGGWMTGAFAGHADGTTFTNCKLTGNSTVANAKFLGGIFGHGAASNTVSSCTVEDSAIDGYWKTGGVSGYICGATVTDTTIKDTTFPGTSFTGALIGHANDGNTTLTDVTAPPTAVRRKSMWSAPIMPAARITSLPSPATAPMWTPWASSSPPPAAPSPSPAAAIPLQFLPGRSEMDTSA